MADQQGVRIEGGKPPNRYTAASIEAISLTYARIAEAFAQAVGSVSTAPRRITIAECEFTVGHREEVEAE